MGTIHPIISSEGRHPDVLVTSDIVHLFGNFITGTQDTFSGASGTYVSGSGGNQILDLDGFSEVLCYADPDIGSGTDVRIKFEFSPDNTAWGQEDVEDLTTAGQVRRATVVHRFAANVKHVFPAPKLGRYMRVTGTFTGTSSSSKLGLSVVASIR